MLKKLSLAALFGAVSLSLVACDGGDNASASTGVAECDQYITALNKLTKDLPDAQKEAYKQGIEQFTKMAKDNPTDAKAQCKAALDAIPAQYR